MTHLCERMQCQPLGTMGTGTGRGNPGIIKVILNMGAMFVPSITISQLHEQSTWVAIDLKAAMMVQTTVNWKRAQKTWALTQMIMKMWRSCPHCPPQLPLCSHPTSKQLELCTIMNNKSSDATPVMRLGTSLMTAQSSCRL